MFIAILNDISYNYSIYIVNSYDFDFLELHYYFKMRQTNDQFYRFTENSASTKVFMIIQLLGLKHSCLSHLSQLMCLIFIYIQVNILYSFCFMLVAQSAESYYIKQKFYKYRWCFYLQSSCKYVPTLGKENGIH